MKLKVLVTIRQGKVGGGESHVLDLIRHLNKSEFIPVALSFTDGPMVDTLRKWGITTYVIYTERAFDVRVWKKVENILVEEEIEIVHAHGTRALSNVFRATRRLGLPLIYTVHGWSFHQDQHFMLRKMREAGERFLTAKADLTICVSNSNLRDGKEIIRVERATMINYGIDLEKFNPADSYPDLKMELGIPQHYTLVGYLVRMTIQKDPYTFIKAIAEVVQSTTDIQFLIVGDGELKAGAMELARQLEVERFIIFQDFRLDIPNVLAGIDVYCLPSLWEGLPIGLLEAMAMKKAIVATPVDGTKEAIANGESGLLIPERSPGELAEAILRIHRDKDMLKKLGSNARKTIEERFEVVRMVREVEQVYRKFTTRTKPGLPIKKMRIGIEAQRLFRVKKHGLEVVALEIIRNLQKLDTFNDYVVFVRSDKDRDCIKETPNFRIREIEAGSFPEWEQIKLPRAVKEEKIDLLHCTANTAPLLASVPIILTLHDIIFTEGTELRGNYYQNFGNIYRKILLPRLKKKVNKIITVSESERQRIIKHLRINPSKVDVIYNAVDSSFVKMNEAELISIRAKYGLPKEFILFFGNSAKKKNSLNTIYGYIHYAEKNDSPLPLVVAGAFEAQIKEALRKMNLPETTRSKIITLGYIPFTEQPAMYNLATLFLYTSKRESFGMPILESMACGTPVVTSNTSSMPEIAGNAAPLVDPNNPESIGDGIIELLGDKALYNTYIEKGLERVKQFDWAQSAIKLLELYSEVLSSKPK